MRYPGAQKSPDGLSLFKRGKAAKTLSDSCCRITRITYPGEVAGGTLTTHCRYSGRTARNSSRQPKATQMMGIHSDSLSAISPVRKCVPKRGRSRQAYERWYTPALIGSSEIEPTLRSEAAISTWLCCGRVSSSSPG